MTARMIYVCDRCKREFETSLTAQPPLHHVQLQSLLKPSEQQQLHICHWCVDVLRDFLSDAKKGLENELAQLHAKLLAKQEEIRQTRRPPRKRGPRKKREETQAHEPE